MPASRGSTAGAVRIDRKTFDFDDLRVHVLDVSGEVDAASASEFQGALIEALDTDPGPVVVSFLRCSFGDTTIVRPIAGAIRRLRHQNHRLAAVVCDDHAVRRVLEFSGLQPHVEVFSTQPAAIAALRRQPRRRD